MFSIFIILPEQKNNNNNRDFYAIYESPLPIHIHCWYSATDWPYPLAEAGCEEKMFTLAEGIVPMTLLINFLSLPSVRTCTF